MNDLNKKKYIELALGDEASFNVDISEDLTDRFSSLSGDENPLHTDAEYAKTTPFQSRIPHGMIAGMLFSRLIGMRLPGKYAVYLSQTLKFHKPLIMGGVLVRGIIIEKSDFSRIIVVHTTLLNSINGDLLVDGRAMVKVLC